MEEKGSGWLTFASMMLIIAGIANFIWGITAVARDGLLVNRFLFANLTFWGILFMVLGVFLVAAGFGVLRKAPWASLFGLVFCSLSIIFYLFAMWAYPAWSILIIAIDILIIYGLASYGETEKAS